MNIKKTLVVIGNGMVGQHFLVNLVASPANENYEIVTFCEEPRPAYDRVHLSAFFSGKTTEDLSLVEPGFFEQCYRMCRRRRRITRITQMITNDALTSSAHTIILSLTSMCTRFQQSMLK